MTEGLFETFPLSLCVPIFCGVTHRRFVAFLPKAEIIVASVAVPEKIIGLTLFLDFFDRCLSLTSLHLPPAALMRSQCVTHQSIIKPLILDLQVPTSDPPPTLL